MLEALRAYVPTLAETRHREDILRLIDQNPGCYHRTHFDPGHITGSGLLVSADGKRVLMNHHRFLDIWICFGGHADGETDILKVALREVVEESGIACVEPVTGGIFDVDVHAIPANPAKGEPPHRHYDIRYLFRVTDNAFEEFERSGESHALRWCGYDAAMALASPADESMHRLLRKWADRP